MSAPQTDEQGIRAIIRAFKAAGWTLRGVRDGEGEFFAWTTEKDAIENLTSCDEGNLYVARGEKDTEGYVRGRVYFVLGNCPDEVVCDWASNDLDALSAVIDPVVDSWF